MPISIPLPQLKRELEDMLLDIQYLATALQRLRDLLPESSEKRVTVLTLLGRLNDVNKKALRGTIDDKDLQLEYNSIRADLSDLVRDLSEADFEEAAAGAPGGAAAPRQGSVLYRIPHTMPLGKETECIVRIAVSEDAIVEEITLDKQVVLKDLSRISDLMQVELTDPAKSPVFQIRSTSSAQQLITAESYTQWYFYVEPLKIGIHSLEVKVSVLEMVMNQVARKEIVFRETVEILTEGESAAEAGFKTALETLHFQGEAPPVAAAPLAAPSVTDFESVIKNAVTFPKAIEKVEPAPSAGRRGLRAVAFFLAFLVLGSTATWALTPAGTRDWWVASWQDTPEAYAGYLEKHPSTRFAEKAYYLRADKTRQLADLRAYQQRYPDGKYRKVITEQIVSLEKRAIDNIRREPTGDNIRQFVADFPDSERYPELKKAVETRSERRTELLAEVETAYVKSTQTAPSAAKVRAYLQDFPEHNRLEEIHAAAKTKPEVMAKIQPELEDAYLKKMEAAPSVQQAETFLEKFPEPVKKEKFEQILEKKPQVRKAILLKKRKMESLQQEQKAQR